MKILLIGNPIASGGNAIRIANRLYDILSQRGHDVEKYITSFAGDAQQRAEKITGDVERIMVIGGDGTLNEVLNGLPLQLQVPLCQVPVGNANLLGRELNLPHRPEEAAILLEQGSIIPVDVGVMNGQRFLMIVSVGFDARVTQEVMRVRKGKINNISYVLPTFKVLSQPEAPELEVEVNDILHAKGKMVVVSQVRCYAGIVEMCYRAGLNSGLLDVVVLPKDNALAILKYLAYARFKKITDCKEVQYFQGTKIKISSPEPVAVEIDGDFCGFTPVDIKLNSGAVRFIIPTPPSSHPSRRSGCSSV